MWFIGLVFKKTENLNIDLTSDIQSFTAQGKVIFLNQEKMLFFYYNYLFSNSSSSGIHSQDC